MLRHLAEDKVLRVFGHCDVLVGRFAVRQVVGEDACDDPECTRDDADDGDNARQRDMAALSFNTVRAALRTSAHSACSAARVASVFTVTARRGRGADRVWRRCLAE